MRRTAFVCLGSHGRGDALHYQELPTKENGEEFFVFFEQGGGPRDRAVKQLFRETISAPRMGSPVNYFLQFIDRLNASAGNIENVERLLAEVVLAILIRRRREAYLFYNAALTIVHWDGAAGAERPVSEIPGFTDVSLRTAVGQGDLFTRFTEELFVLKSFSIADGNHTLVLAPSDDFIRRSREALHNSVFFPGFTLRPDRDVAVETSRSFPAIHWNTTGEETVKQASNQQRKFLGRFSVPAIVGIVTALVAFLIFFGPLSRDGTDEANDHALISADESGLDAGMVDGGDEPPASVETPERDASDRAEHGGAIELVPAWSKRFPAPVTSSPRFGGGTVFFGCRDGHLYAYDTEGTRKWQHAAGDGVGASPFYIDRYIVGADYGGNVFCLDAASGAPVWSYAANERIVSSPQAAGGMVVVGTMEGRCIALDLSDGSKRWSQKVGTGIWANVHIGEGWIVVATTDGSLVKLAHDGTITWRVKPGGGILSSPLCLESDDLIVFGSKDTYIYAYSLSRGDLMWRAATGGEVNGGAVSNGETVLIGADDGNIYALSLSGRVRWTRNVGGAVKSIPLIVGERVFVTSYGSKLDVLDLASGEVVGSHRVDAQIYSSPAHDGSHVYFGTNGGAFHALWMYGEER